MRRFLTRLAVALLLLGLEITTGVVSLTITRLTTGLTAALRGDDSLVPASRHGIGLVLTLGGAVVLGALRWLDRIERRAARGDVCPKCRAETFRVPRHAGDRMLTRLIDERMKRHKCVRCGWSGLAI